MPANLTPQYKKAEEEYRRVTIMRRVLADMNPPDAMELLTRQLMKTKTNAEFLMSMNMK